MDLKLADLSAHERYKLLIGLVIPRPIAWISTWSANGVANCAPFSFFNVISEEPPLCILSFNRRSDGAMKHTLKNIRRTGEYVVNLADGTSRSGLTFTRRQVATARAGFPVAADVGVVVVIGSDRVGAVELAHHEPVPRQCRDLHPQVARHRNHDRRARPGTDR